MLQNNTLALQNYSGANDNKVNTTINSDICVQSGSLRHNHRGKYHLQQSKYSPLTS